MPSYQQALYLMADPDGVEVPGEGAAQDLGELGKGEEDLHRVAMDEH